MDDSTRDSQPANTQQTWVEPAYEVIALDCEITAYAPDGDFPLL